MFKRLHRRLRRIQWKPLRLAASLPASGVVPGSALRECLREGYSLDTLRRDLLAGLTVGIVALPLSMALAIAAGVPPQYGLYTAIVGGFIVALCGGSRLQVTGPTAAFVVLLAPVMLKFGLPGLLIATLLAGLLLVLFGLMRFGRLISFIPDPVVTGFTAGIAVVIATLQLKDFLGLEFAGRPEHYWEHWLAIKLALPGINFAEAGLGLFSLAVLVFWPRLVPRIPSPLAALGLASLAAWLLVQFAGIELHTIGNTFSYVQGGRELPGIPPLPPAFVWPWLAGGTPLALDYETLSALLPPAFGIAVLGAIESLLSAVIADGLAGTNHDPDSELVALGLGNLVAPFFGGFACTGALARTATNIKAGARTPVAAMFHSLFILLAVLLCAPLLSWMPMAAFAALLLVVAWNMSDARHFAHIMRVAPRSDVWVMLICFALTVLFDMVLAISVGLMLAALLFIRRMVEVSGAALVDTTHPSLREKLPAGALLYEINGPLFFGAAKKAMASLAAIHRDAVVVILDVTRVPAIDATGLVNLESTLSVLLDNGTRVIICGLQEQPARSLAKAGITQQPGALYLSPDLPAARELAAKICLLRE